MTQLEQKLGSKWRFQTGLGATSEFVGVAEEDLKAALHLGNLGNVDN